VPPESAKQRRARLIKRRPRWLVSPRWSHARACQPRGLAPPFGQMQRRRSGVGITGLPAIAFARRALRTARSQCLQRRRPPGRRSATPMPRLRSPPASREPAERQKQVQPAMRLRSASRSSMAAGHAGCPGRVAFPPIRAEQDARRRQQDARPTRKAGLTGRTVPTSAWLLQVSSGEVRWVLVWATGSVARMPSR
jgi:hypothetical protein